MGMALLLRKRQQASSAMRGAVVFFTAPCDIDRVLHLPFDAGGIGGNFLRLHGDLERQKCEEQE